MIIKSAKFIKSSLKAIDCPETDIHEFTFIGRSNVGKSSLINMLINKKIAKVSRNPGKTLLINHFLINNNWFLVDLPGYGYAKISKKEKRKIENIIIDYFKNRTNLSLTFVLIDIRHEPQLIDLDFISWLSNNNINFKIIFTKADKLKPNQKDKKVKKYLKILFEKIKISPENITCSSKLRLGRDEIMNLIHSEL